ncbi:MFS transporter [Alteribacter natronophilus]|uniref:MFS transporter n=1 Tax=Alteribacter natronophilus TaxID=2583810 RepID=UPI00110E7CFD|nr:MFS transporter [Alteribacter natronophilus]TMW70983.1 MFS transporter [Alteribacter natronophilus]
MYKRVLKNRNVRIYLAGAGISRMGNVVAGMAFLFLAYELTGSAVLTTGIAAAQALPYLFFGLIGGAVADRADKKRLMIAMDLLRVPLVLSLVVFYQLDLLGYGGLVAAAFALQTCGCFYNPAYRAVLPLITAEEERTTVNGLYDSVTRGVQVGGPVISVVLLTFAETIHFFTFDAITYVISAALIFRLSWREPVRNVEEKTESIFSSLAEFFRWVKRQREARTLFLVTFVMVFFNTWVWQVGLLMLMTETTVRAEEWYSGLMGWFGAGVITANLLVPFIWKRMSLGLYLAGSAVWGAGILVIGLGTALPVYFIGAGIVALGLPVAGLARVYLLQTLVPAGMLGRGFSFNAVLLYGSNVISLGVYGVLALAFPLKVLFVFSGSVMILAACGGLLLERKRRGIQLQEGAFYENNR